MAEIKNTCYPNMAFTTTIEDIPVGHLTYILNKVNRWYPSPAKVTKYVASLRFGQGKDDQIELILPKIDDLDEVIEFLIELKMKWEVANKTLADKEKSLC